MISNPIKELSIQVHLSGLSFCILNRSDNSISYLNHFNFEKKLTPNHLLEELKKTLSSESAFSELFSVVTLIYQNELATVVPQSLYSDLNKADYLKFNSKILQTDVIECDELAINQSVVVYVPYMNINNYIFETFGEFTFKHSTTVLIDSLLQRTDKGDQPEVFVNVNSNHFEMLVVKSEGLQFYNYFEYQTSEDFIYYLLFSLEQQQLNPEDVTVNFTGDIEKDDTLYTMAYTYIRHVKLFEPNHRFKFEKGCHPKQPHHQFVILNSF